MKILNGVAIILIFWGGCTVFASENFVSQSQSEDTYDYRNESGFVEHDSDTNTTYIDLSDNPIDIVSGINESGEDNTEFSPELAEELTDILEEEDALEENEMSDEN